jgi:hypothetical protein
MSTPPARSRQQSRRLLNVIGLALALVLLGGHSTLSGGRLSNQTAPSTGVVCSDACVPPCFCEADFLTTTCLTPNYFCKCNAG